MERLRERMRAYHLTYAWLVDQLSRAGYEIDKYTLSATVNRQVRGRRAEEVERLGNEVLDRYEKVWLGRSKHEQV